MRTLIYTSVKDQAKAAELAASLRTSSKDTSSVRVYEFWQGEIEKCDLVVTDNERVEKAYAKAGIKVEPLTTQEKVDVQTEVEQTQEPVRRMGRPRKGGE